MADTYLKSNSPEAFFTQACETIINEANSQINKKGNFTLVLSGGNTPVKIFHKLSTIYSDRIDWSKTHIFWLDERCAPPEHPDSNYGMANSYLLSRIPEPASVNRMKGEIEPDLAALEYQNLLLSFFGSFEDVKFDFMLIGVGDDGHVASIFPDSYEFQNGTSDFVFATKNPYNGHRRISLSLELINRVNCKLVLLNSVPKKEVFFSKDPSFPLTSIKDRLALILE